MRINIAGQFYPIRGLDDQSLLRLESYIKSKYERLVLNKGETRAGNMHERDLILLLINVANDYIEAQDRIKDIKKEMILKIDTLVNKIDSAL